jgi:2-(1,2-epoxy-1,2-dihydrophenyl)acetyl-CoA isomerase
VQTAVLTLEYKVTMIRPMSEATGAIRCEAETSKLVQRLARQAPIALGHTKRLINASLEQAMETQLNHEAIGFSECAATDDWAEGVKAFIEKRKPVFKAC